MLRRVAVWVLAAALPSAGCGMEEVQEEADLSFVRVQGGPAVEDRASTGGVSWIDYDADGDLDLFVTNGYDVSAEEAVPQPNRLYENLGDGRLRPVERGPLVRDSGFSSGSAWADYDNDGDVDVFVSNQRGQDNFLYRNRGDGTFERVIRGPVVSDSAGSGAVAWGDYDGDGDQDLFVANRWDPGRAEGPGRSRLYRNEGDWRFTRVQGPPSGDTLIAISAAWADYDNDKDLDLFVASQGGPANRLYRNDGEAGFHRVEGDPSVLDGGHTSGATWGDADNDGDLDLVVTNWDAAPVLYENDGRGGFRRAAAGDLGRTREHPGNLAWGDHDGDGDLDLYVGNWPNWPGEGEENELYRNQGATGNWLIVRLVGTESNRSGIGARVTARAEIGGRAVTQLRELGTQTSWRSQEALLLHFGLGDADVVEELVIRWPSDSIQRLSDVAASRLITVTEEREP